VGAVAIDRLLEGLNEPQREAVLHGEGPLLILAGAGSGKTRVLTHRIAHLVGTGQAAAGEILAITFTNKAAQEMRERVEALVGGRARAMWVMTFHSACARMLRSDAERLGYTRGFTIYDEQDSLRLVKNCMEELDVDPKRYAPRGIRRQISDAKNALLDAEAYRLKVSSFFEQTAADVYDLYEQRLHAANAMDFDDLLFRCVNLFELFPEVRDRYRRAFRHVLVDEYQDTNRAQYRWLQLLCEEHRNLCVVGDDDQCLVEGTRISMADGSTRPIQELREGDVVLSSYGSGDFRPARVTRTHRSHAREGVAIGTRDGRRIVSTPEHVHFAGPDRHSSRGHDGRRPGVSVTLCADRRGRTPVHQVAVSGREPGVRRALESHGLTVRPAEDGSGGWSHESGFESYPAAMDVVDRIQTATPVSVRRAARLGARRGSGAGESSLPFMPAASVRPGMAMFAEDGSYDVVESVERVAIEGPVYDLDVEGTHNLVAGGLVTHNSIYRFRGADIRNILDFEGDFPDATVVKLEQNYRSTQTILNAANAIIANNRARKEKSLWSELGQGDPVHVGELEDEHGEARFVVSEIERLVDEGGSRDEIAVFYRTHAQSRVLEDALVRYGVSYQVLGGPRFYERAEIKDALAYLTLLVNPSDTVAFGRIVNSPRRGIGQTSQGRLLGHANTIGAPVWDVAAEPERVPGLAAAATKAVGRFMSVMERLRERVEGGASVGDVLAETLEETGYLEALRAERTVEAQVRVENLDELVGVAREYDAAAGSPAPDGAPPAEEPSLEQFLQQIALFSEQDKLQDEQGLLTLMTLHNAKGLEFGTVFIIGLEDGVFPHSRAVDAGDLEEERRLAYVGVTRAKRELYLTYARTRALFGRRDWNLRSRFVDEIPIELTDRDEEAPTGRAAAATWGGGTTGVPEPRTPAVSFALGEDVVHANFGDGVVVGVEPGGLVVVRFAGDGSERKLMADYAPLKRRS
jgi:superfamily I DNA/RNA helicase